ncbi:hypothetical protein EMCRGX_G013620 [Ephydatia muelleri]
MGPRKINIGRRPKRARSWSLTMSEEVIDVSEKSDVDIGTQTDELDARIVDTGTQTDELDASSKIDLESFSFFHPSHCTSIPVTAHPSQSLHIHPSHCTSIPVTAHPSQSLHIHPSHCTSISVTAHPSQSLHIHPSHCTSIPVTAHAFDSNTDTHAYKDSFDEECLQLKDMEIDDNQAGS